MRLASLIAALLLFSVAHADDSNRWHLIVKFYNVLTDEQVDERELQGSNEPEGGYGDAFACVKDAVAILEKGMPQPAGGVKLALSCRRGEAGSGAHSDPKITT